MSANRNPIPKADIVKKLMSDEGDDPDDKNRMILKCLRPGCGEIIKKFKGSGYTNPYNHLVSKKCYGSDAEVQQVYKRLKLEEDDGNPSSIKNHFAPAATSREQAMHGWIVLIVMRGLALNAVEDKLFRKFFKFSNDPISIKALVRTIFQLVILVEKKISNELANTTCGAIMHDAWTRDGVHYVAMFGCYIKEKKNDDKPASCCNLLAVSPMPTTDEKSGTEAVRFRADVFLNFFESTLNDFYNIDIRTWCKAIIADNTSTNRKVARDLGIPHIGCYSHKLNLDVEAMIEENPSLASTINKVHEVMSCAKLKLRNAALLRNITELRPILHNKTRWSGKGAMLTWFIRMHPHLIEAAESPESEGLNQVFDKTEAFLNKAKKYKKWMSIINTITKKLQERCLPLSTAHHLMEFLQSEVDSRRNKESDPLHGCPYTRKKSGLDNTSAQDFVQTRTLKLES
jgi:hypothetical protein